MGWLTDLTHAGSESDLAIYHYDYEPVGNRWQAVETVFTPNLVYLPVIMNEEGGLQSMVQEQAMPEESLDTFTDPYPAPEDSFVPEMQSLEEDPYPAPDAIEPTPQSSSFWDQVVGFFAWLFSPSTAVQASSFDQAYPAPGGVEPSPNTLPMSTVSITYLYDQLHRLTQADYTDGTYFHYTYDSNGNRLTETTQAGTKTSIFDAANRLTSVDGTSYTWDDNGNLTNDGTQTYSYDHANRLTSVGRAGVTVGYQYNGLGDRVRETNNGVTTNFTLDLNNSLTQVLSDGTNTHLYGTTRIGQFTAMDSAYFLGDALGSVRQLVDASGAVVLTKSYDPYGNGMANVGAASSRYGYTGEQTDSYIKLIYLRSRYYSSSIGRFTTRDSWPGDLSTPMSYNAWLYGYSNPVRFSDHSGKRPIECFSDEPGCSQDGRWLLAEHFLWVPGDIVLSSIGEVGLLGYWSHAFGIIATWPKDYGVSVIALPPWEGDEEVGWQDDVTEDTLDNQYNDWVVLRVDVVQAERDKAVSWASAQIGAPFISMYPRLVAQVGSWIGLSLERDIEKYSWAGWLHSEEGFYCFQFPVEAYLQGSGYDITDRTFVMESNNYDASLAMGYMFTPYLGDEVFRSNHVSIISRKSK